jgi:hypothetical protein
MLPAVLKGLSKHAHLIDAAFFGDLMKVLKTIMEDSDLGVGVVRCPSPPMPVPLLSQPLLATEGGISILPEV